MKLGAALASGLIGAGVLTLIHEVARRNIDEAPRMDILGMRAIAQGAEMAGETPPSRDTLFDMAMAGDIVFNALYYSLVAWGGTRGAVRRGALLGLAAGVGGVVLPGRVGLGDRPSARTKATQAMTVAWYTLGGLAAAAAFQKLGGQDE